MQGFAESTGRSRMTNQKRRFVCISCTRTWDEPYGTGRPEACPLCGSANFRRTDEDRGQRRTCGGRRRNKARPSKTRGGQEYERRPERKR